VSLSQGSITAAGFGPPLFFVPQGAKIDASRMRMVS
jgi:hypothetical protein